MRPSALTTPIPVPGWSRYYGSVGLTAIERFRLMRFERMTDGMLLRWSDGLVFQVQPDQLSWALYVSGTYEPNTLCVLRRLLGPGDQFIDIGASRSPYARRYRVC